MINIIPMAGLGSRFAQEGYLLPKALVPVSGKPMITQVINHLPEAEKSVFIIRKEHLTDYKIDEVIISACDNAFVFNVEKFEALKKRSDVDCIVWTFTQDELLTAKPEAWGWIKLDSDGETINDMSVKIPVSDDPFNDHAVVATFWFRRAG